MSPICSKIYLFCFLELLLNITYFARKLHLFCLGLCSALLSKFLLIYRNGIIKVWLFYCSMVQYLQIVLQSQRLLYCSMIDVSK